MTEELIYRLIGELHLIGLHNVRVILKSYWDVVTRECKMITPSPWTLGMVVLGTFYILIQLSKYVFKINSTIYYTILWVSYT